jgi:hypothetical protein
LFFVGRELIVFVKEGSNVVVGAGFSVFVGFEEVNIIAF